MRLKALFKKEKLMKVHVSADDDEIRSIQPMTFYKMFNKSYRNWR